jgi:hypothetical protein
MAMKAYQEIQAEQRNDSQVLDLIPEGTSLLHGSKQGASLPSGSLLLGLAEDGLPVLLNLYDPTPGPLLIAGDQGSGKTVFLKWLAHASDFVEPGDLQFGVVTPFPEEWGDIEDLPNGMGIWPAYHPSAHQFLSRLVYWAETLPKTRQAILVLVDGLDLLSSNSFHLQQELRWLLENGPQRQIWPVVSTNPAHLSHMLSWLGFFHTRILGKVKHAHNTRLLIENKQVFLDSLIPGTEFILSQPDNYFKFLLPPLLLEGV